MPKGNETGPQTTDPTELQILAELKQKEKRKAYMQSEKAQTNRKVYMKKKYEQTKQTRSAIEELKRSDPAKYEELLAKAKAAASG